MRSIDLTQEHLELQKKFLWQLALRCGCDGRALDDLMRQYTDRAEGRSPSQQDELVDTILDERAMLSLGLCDEDE